MNFPTSVSRGYFLRLAPIAAVALFFALRPQTAPMQSFQFHQENVLGTSFALKVQASSAEAAERAQAASLAEIDRLNQLLSSYDANSEFRRWSATFQQPVSVSPELFAMLQAFDTWRARTGGILNPSAQVGLQIWKQAERTQQEPSTATLAEAAAEMGQAHWTLDQSRQTATRLTRAPLVLNSFVKSYIANAAAELALRTGKEEVAGVVINLGGDLIVKGEANELVRIADPAHPAENSPALSQLQVRNLTVATSGHYRRGVMVAGKWRSHILDPRTAQPADGLASATILSADPIQAGALATALTVLPLEEAERLAQAQRGADYFLVAKNGEQRKSKGWRAKEGLAATHARPASPTQLLAAAPAAGQWDPAYELQIQLELGRPEAGRYKRPFVAVWIEDKDKFPLRTIALWYDRPRWLPDLRLWYKSDRLRSLADGNELADSLASATRPSGKYTLHWDGKDNKGQYVKAGHYTVCIEAAREHGTYQVIRQEMDFPAPTKLIQLPGNVEVASASLEYRKTNGH